LKSEPIDNETTSVKLKTGTFPKIATELQIHRWRGRGGSSNKSTA